MDKREHSPKDWQMIDLSDRAKSISTVAMADRKSDGKPWAGVCGGGGGGRLSRRKKKTEEPRNVRSVI